MQSASKPMVCLSEWYHCGMYSASECSTLERGEGKGSSIYRPVACEAIETCDDIMTGWNPCESKLIE